jgi:hypothetical protein
MKYFPSEQRANKKKIAGKYWKLKRVTVVAGMEMFISQ